MKQRRQKLEHMTLDEAKATIEAWSAKPMMRGGFVTVVHAAWLVLEECRRLEQERAEAKAS